MIRDAMDAFTPDVGRHRPGQASEDESLFAPLRAPPAAADGCFVLGRLAQSLDGYIATSLGESRWISGPDDIVHTHRLRALCDAVVVGAGTVRADDPQLTTRLVDGSSPVRVVLDPDRRLATSYKVFGDGPRTLLVCAKDAGGAPRHGQAEVLRVPRHTGSGLDIAALLAELANRGLRRIMVEGGGITVSRFLAAEALDRLHVTIAPVLVGGGIPSFALPGVQDLMQARRFTWTVHRAGQDLLLDIPLTRRG